jgi:hypothetical protein
MSNVHYYEPWPEPPPRDPEKFGRLAMLATIEPPNVELQLAQVLARPVTVGDLITHLAEPAGIANGIDPAALDRASDALDKLEKAGAREVRNMRRGAQTDTFIPIAELRAQIAGVREQLVPLERFSRRRAAT